MIDTRAVLEQTTDAVTSIVVPVIFMANTLQDFSNFTASTAPCPEATEALTLSHPERILTLPLQQPLPPPQAFLRLFFLSLTFNLGVV